VSGSIPGIPDEGRLRELMDDNFVRYAAYVIRDRAIPDLADGLKPVQRRILHSLFETDDGKLIKDPAAAPRYIECRLTDLARNELFNPELTRYVKSYDGRRKEPVALPAKLPLLLMLGAEGIAVGLSTRILPHNFGELLTAQIHILEGKFFDVLPDFQQGGVMEVSEYERGKGRVRLRAEVEPAEDDASRLIIRSVPYGVTTDSMIASIEAAARKKKLAVKSIDDFTSEQVEIRIELKPDQDVTKAIHALYAFTHCEVTLSSRIVVIHKQRPVELDVDKVLRHNTKQLVTILRRELESERRKNLEKIHAKTLVQLFVENRIYKRIEECTTLPDMQKVVLDGVNAYRDQLSRDVTMKDVEMLLAIKIKRISRYDRDRNRKEIDDLWEILEEIERHLSDMTAYTIRYLRSIRRKYAVHHPRRTQIVDEFDSIAVRELTADELTLRYDAKRGYLGHEVKGDELFQCSSLDKLLVLRADGRYSVTNPPAKLFVDRSMPWCGQIEKDRVCLMVYREEDGLSYVKRFAFGGTILNREYTTIPKGSTIEFFSIDDPKTMYIRSTDGGGQVVDLEKVPARSVKAQGFLLTSKAVKSIDVDKPKDWSDRRFGKARPPLGLKK
jgi:topoisomerase-4 subunit A